jgi:glycosyl transferase, family 25
MASIPIFYINLAGRTDRRRLMEGQFQALGLAARRIEAVTPAELTPADLARYGDPQRLHWLTPTEISCSLSHLKAMRAFTAGGAPHAVIFEDDVVLSPSLPGFLTAFEAAPPAFGLVKLETFDEPLRLKPGNEGEIAGVALRRGFGGSSGSAGYIVSRRAAEIILGRDDLCRASADRALFNPHEPLGRHVTMRLADPGLCIQEHRLPGRSPTGNVSDLHTDRTGRAAAEQPLSWRRLPLLLARGFNRDIREGSIKTWHQIVGGARKQRIPFKAD